MCPTFLHPTFIPFHFPTKILIHECWEYSIILIVTAPPSVTTAYSAYKMGAGKSKSTPIVESARTVIARRKKESTTIVIDTIDASVNEVVNADLTQSESALAKRPSANISSSETAYSPEIINSMSHWGNYVKTTTYQVNILFIFPHHILH